jgi:hypothetical protein
VGYLAFGSREQHAHLSKAFEEGLQSLGYRVNENVTIEYRLADGQFERLPTLAAEIVRLGVDVIVTGNHANAVAAMKATTTIPIVMTNSTDPVSPGSWPIWRARARNSSRLPLISSPGSTLSPVTFPLGMYLRSSERNRLRRPQRTRSGRRLQGFAKKNWLRGGTCLFRTGSWHSSRGRMARQFRRRSWM